MSQKLPQILENTITKIREMVDSNSVVGEPIAAGDGVTIIPISKIFVGLATGGVDYFGKKAPTNKNFGGGGGTGVTVSPIGFLVVDPKGKVELLNVNSESKDPISQIVGLIESSPEIIEKFKNLFGKKGNNDLDEEE